LIYADTSVVLAQLLADDRCPPAGFWQEALVSSRLLEYEIWNRLNARKLAQSHGEAARSLIGRVALLELAPPVLARALEPFPAPVRTLDALHLASADFLRSQGQQLKVATYDERMARAAQALGFKMYAL
jgi:predicted nucleic acid-binding protein